MINVGVRVPVNERDARSTQVLTYFLWDWFDGGLLRWLAMSRCPRDARRLPVAGRPVARGAAVGRAGRGAAAAQARSAAARGPGRCSRPSHDCMACHNGLTTPTGEDVSIGVSLARVDDGELLARSVLAGRASGANDRPSGSARAAIEDECSICHMPMARTHGARRRPAQARCSRTCRSARGEPETIGWPPTACRARMCHQIGPRAARHARELHRRLRHQRRRRRRRRAGCSDRSRSSGPDDA